MTELSALHEAIKSAPRQFLVVAEPDVITGVKAYISDLHKGFIASNDTAAFDLPKMRETVKQAWLTSTQVSFCAKAYPTVPVGHKDAPVLSVLGGFLRNGYLHRCIREQGGAYGGGATQDSATASFRFYSYRDPRLTETLDDFHASITWLMSESHANEKMEQAVIGGG